MKVVPYDGGVAHFLADPSFGQQCYVTSEPIAARQKGADPKVFLIADSGFNPYATVVITRRELLQKNPGLVKEFVLATREGWRDYLDHPEVTNALLGKLNSALDAATLSAAAEAQRPLIENDDTKQRGLGQHAASPLADAFGTTIGSEIFGQAGERCRLVPAALNDQELGTQLGRPCHAMGVRFFRGSV